MGKPAGISEALVLEMHSNRLTVCEIFLLTDSSFCVMMGVTCRQEQHRVREPAYG
jgi:hypothetical protein